MMDNRWIRYRMGFNFTIIGVVVYLTSMSTFRVIEDSFGDRRNKAEAARLVQGLLTADTLQLNTAMENLADYRTWAVDDLAAAFAESPDDSNAKLHAALGLLQDDESALGFLSKRLLTAEPRQIPIMIHLLASQQDKLVDDLWQATEINDGEDSARLLRASSALAAYDAGNQANWSAIAERVANGLVIENPMHVAVWMQTLQPAKRYLIEPLAAAYRNVSGRSLINGNRLGNKPTGILCRRGCGHAG